MSLDLCILASGSAGNCSVVRSPRGALLIDAGIGPRTLGRRLAELGLHLDRVAGVCLTHLDRDHLSGSFLTWLSRRGLPIFCHRHKVHALHHLAGRQTVVLKNVHAFDEVPFEPVDGVKVEAVAAAHDAEGSHAFILQAKDRRIGFATDLGRVPPELLEKFCAAGGLDVLAIESNYCPDMQLASSRPAFLKRRIMGGYGHLSNLQALAAVRQTLDRHQANGHGLPSNIVLLHRSRDCNCPLKMRSLFSRDARIAPRLVIAEQSEPTGWLVRRGARVQQMTFAWG